MILSGITRSLQPGLSESGVFVGRMRELALPEPASHSAPTAHRRQEHGD